MFLALTPQQDNAITIAMVAAIALVVIVLVIRKAVANKQPAPHRWWWRRPHLYRMHPLLPALPVRSSFTMWSPKPLPCLWRSLLTKCKSPLTSFVSFPSRR